jgi:large subunit ribosomal protein L10
MKKSEKPIFVENLTAELKEAASVVVIDYTGLSVKLQQNLKKRLKEVNARLEIVKNTLLKLAGAKAELPEESLSDSVLSGPTAIVITESDPIAPLQTLAKFATEFEIPNLKVGVIEGKFQDKDTLVALSKLPSKEALFAQAVGAISSPMYGLVGTLQGNLQKLVWILDTKRQAQ